MAQINAQVPGAELVPINLDLSDLVSVAAAAAAAREAAPVLDILMNNAGIMAPPLRRSAQGFELQIATNHLGHFALTAQLLPSLLAAASARVVTTSSGAHRVGTIDHVDLTWQTRKYHPWRAYGQSKLANLLFTLELQHRAEFASAPLLALAAHPGYAATHLQSAQSRLSKGTLEARFMAVGNKLFAQPAEMGALPQLYAATAPGVIGGTYFGPDGRGEMRGYPAIAGRSKTAQDSTDAAWLWQESERLTGVTVAFPPMSSDR